MPPRAVPAGRRRAPSGRLCSLIPSVNRNSAIAAAQKLAAGSFRLDGLTVRRVWMALSAARAALACRRAFSNSIVLASQTVQVTIEANDQADHDGFHHHVGIHEHAPW